MAPQQSNYKQTPCEYFAQGHCKSGDVCTFRHDEAGSSAMVPYTGSTTAEVAVSTVKGKTVFLTMSLDATLSALAQSVVSKFNYSPDEAETLRLFFNGKELRGTSATLQKVGVKAGVPSQRNKFVVAVKFTGGAPGQSRSAEREIAIQLKYMKHLHGVIQYAPEEDDIRTINVILRGAADSPYSKGAFQVQIRCSDSYPREAPVVHFLTPIFHPNVWPDGELCWHSDDNIGERYFMDAVVGAINLLVLRVPNPDSPANGEAADYTSITGRIIRGGQRR